MIKESLSFKENSKMFLEGIKGAILIASPVLTIILGFGAFVSWFAWVDLKEIKVLWGPIVLTVLTILFTILWIYNKFFRKRRKQG